MKTFITLTDEQFDNMEIRTRRSLMEQLMIIDTPKYRYALGCTSYPSAWTIYQYDRLESIGKNKWQSDYKPTRIDKWF